MTAADESLHRAAALQMALAAVRDRRCTLDEALLTALQRLAEKATFWASVAAEHGADT